MYENIKLITYNENSPFGIRFVGETVCDEKFVIKRNKSDLAAFEYIVEGTGILEINGKLYHPKKGDMFFLAEGSRHLYYSQKENGWHKYFISFYGDVANTLIKNYLNTQDINKATGQLASELFNIFNAVYNRRILDSEDLADKIKRYMDNNLSREFALNELCADLNYSKNHIINVFMKKFGETPYKYYSERKIELAKEYLTNSGMTIAEISNSLSYADQQYFSYCFKKATGLTPRKYRQLTAVY